MSDMPVTDFIFEEERLKEMVSGQTHKLDSQLHVTFYKRGVLNNFKSATAGRKIFEEKVYVRILMPANRLAEVDREASDEDRVRFLLQFTSFVQKGETLQVGTPLDQLPNMSQALLLELKHLKVDTVEQLAGMADTTVSLLGTGGQTMKQSAIRFLDRNRDNEQLSTEVRELRAQLAELVEQGRKAAEAAIQVSSTTVALVPAKVTA